MFRHLNAHDEDISRLVDSVGMWNTETNVWGVFGAKERAVIARMFVSDPDVFILDEPTTGMDAGENEFNELHAISAHHHGKAVLMITMT